MRIRHRIPMIFSLSMMDVFCCTLGCVILLWLVNQREAMKQTNRAASSLSQLKLTEDKLNSRTGERDRLRDQLVSADKDLAKYREDLAAARQQVDDTADRLAKKIADEKALARQLSAAQGHSAELETLVRERDEKLTTAAKRSSELGELLDEAQSRADALRSTAELVPGLKKAAGTAQDQLAAAESRIRGLERDVTDARHSASGLETDKRELTSRLARAQAAIENRFEGIALTGKRVVFIVDMSGSMELIDNNTQSPSKWPAVCESMAKILRSLPDAQNFQVIVFSDTLAFPLGNEGRWLNVDAATVQRAQAALTAIKPKGGTNMYAALEAAFRYRSQGLDTIYLLSDGLPNMGAGVNPEAAKTMTEAQLADILGRHIRNTLKTSWNNPRSGPKVRINSVGFFFESPEVGAFLWALSRENDGSFVGMSKP